MPDEPVAHLPRPVPPWEEAHNTLCGRDMADVAKMGTIAAFIATVRKHGQRRAAFDYCQSCASHTRTAVMTWEKNPIEIMSDWVGRGIYTAAPDQERITANLYALAALVEAHPEEFEAHRDATKEGAVSLSGARLAKRRLRGIQ